MNLIIDVGNTYTKIGVFTSRSLEFKDTVSHRELVESINNIIKQYPEIEDAIISSVSNISSDQLKYLHKKFNTIVLNATTELPFKNLYATPKTLGVDRIALVAAAVDQYPSKDVLVIDAGTCITYDFKNKKEEYLGGAISPGIRLRYKSLHDYTAKLPLLETNSIKNIIGNNTIDSIHSGVVFGVEHEIDGLIKSYCNIYPKLTVILTGGDTHFLSKRLKNGIFANPNFLMEGLNYILDFKNSK